MSNLDNSFNSVEDIVQPRTKLVKTRVSATVSSQQRPFKVYKLKLELDKEEDEAFGTISFDITPVRTPCCKCPNAPKIVKGKLLLKLRNISRLVFPEDEEEDSVSD